MTLIVSTLRAQMFFNCPNPYDDKQVVPFVCTIIKLRLRNENHEEIHTAKQSF